MLLAIKEHREFGFLFDGEYFNYCKYRVKTEQAILKQKYVWEQSQPMSNPQVNYSPPII